MMKYNKPIALAVALAATVAATMPVAGALAATADSSVSVSRIAPGQAASQGSLDRRRESLSYTVAGKRVVVPAGWVSGDGFSLMAITGGYATHADAIVTVVADDSSAMLRIERMTGVAPKAALDKVKERLKRSNYVQFANNMNARSGDAAYRMVATGDGIRANVYAMPAGGDTVVVTETYDLDKMTEQEPALAAMRETLSIRSGLKPAPTPTPSTQPIGGDPRTWSPNAEIRYKVGNVAHVATGSKTISDMGYVMYRLGGYDYVGGNGYDVFQRRTGNAMLTVYASRNDAQTSRDQQAAFLTKQGYAERSREAIALSSTAYVVTMTKGENALRITTIPDGDGGCYVLRESFGSTGDATAPAEMRAMIGTFVQY